MPSILDIAPDPGHEVPLGERGSVTIKGLPNDVWAALYAKYPPLIQMVQSGMTSQEVVTGDIETITSKIEALLGMISAGTALADGAPFDSPPHAAAVLRLSFDEIVAVSAEVVKRSYPAEMLVPLRAALANGHAAAPDGKGPATS